VRLTRKGDARYRELHRRFLRLASTVCVDLSETDVRKATKILRELTADMKGRWKQRSWTLRHPSRRSF
jgi:hypothetical protein